MVRPAVPVELNGILAQTTGILGVGTRLTTLSNARDAVVLRLSGASPSASFVGGANNDQFYAVAERQGSALAVGLSRTFETAGRTSDPAFLVTIPASGALTAVIHENIPDVGLQPRAADTTATGYIVAGRYNDEVEGYLGLVTPTAQAGTTVRFAIPNFSDVRVRQVRADGPTAVVVGDVTANSVVRGFVAGFELPSLRLRYGFLVTMPGASMNLTDVAVTSGGMVAVGQSGADGVVLTFDSVTGQLSSTARVPLLRLQSIVGPAPALVSGLRGGSLVVARLGATSLAGASFLGLGNASNISPLPLARTDGGAVVFGRSADAGLVQIELNDDLRGGCNGAVSGTPVQLSVTPDAGIAVTSMTPVVVPISVRVTAVRGLLVTPLAIAPADACWP